MQHHYAYRNGVMEPVESGFDPAETDGWSCIDEYGKFPTQDVWGKEDRFVVRIDVDSAYGYYVQIEGLPDYLNFVRDYLLPLVTLQNLAVPPPDEVIDFDDEAVRRGLQASRE